MEHVFRICAALTLSFGIGQTGQASTLQMLLESDANRGAGSEVFGVTFDTYADLLAGTFSSSGFSQLDINPNFSMGGLAYDGQYQMLLESDANRGAGSEVFGVTFDTYADLLAGTFSSSGFSQLDINPNFSMGGLAYDGQYQMLLESDANRGAGSEVFGVTFDTYADLLAGTFSSSGFSQLDINRNFSMGGLAYDGQYQMLLESDANRGAGSEVFGVTFDTYADLLAGTFSSSGFSQLDINPNFSMGGLAYDGFPAPPNPPTVPLPAGGLLLFSGLAGVAGLRRWKSLKPT